MPVLPIPSLFPFLYFLLIPALEGCCKDKGWCACGAWHSLETQRADNNKEEEDGGGGDRRTERALEASRPYGAPRPFCPTVCLWALPVSFSSKPSLSAPQGKLCERFRMNQTHPSLCSRVPFFPRSCPCVRPPSLSLCPSAPLSALSPCVCHPHLQFCVHLSLPASPSPPESLLCLIT